VIGFHAGSRQLERFLLIAGLALCVAYAALRVRSSLLAGESIERFDSLKGLASSSQVTRVAGVDVSLWDPTRVSGFKASLSGPFPPPLAVLEIPRVQLRVPVFDGTEETVLDRGAGRIIGTAHPGTGNMGIAGHRDGFFRVLKDVVVGDKVELATTSGAWSYVVDGIEIVDPTDVHVLEDRGSPALTLVTCYPFYFIGSAPKRYIVECSMKPPGGKNQQASKAEAGGHQ